MFMTELQPKQPGDDRRAEEIVEILGKSIASTRTTASPSRTTTGFFSPTCSSRSITSRITATPIVAGFSFSIPRIPLRCSIENEGRLRARRRDVHRSEKCHRAAAERTRPALRRPLARAREFLPAARAACPCSKSNWKEFGLPAPSPPRTPARRPTAAGSSKFSAGWSTSTPSSPTPTKSGRIRRRSAEQYYWRREALPAFNDLR